jgi:hypothetical protein
MASHGVDGWYVGPSIEHYRCHKYYIPSTFSIRNAFTVDWFPLKGLLYAMVHKNGAVLNLIKPLLTIWM